jgi:predicted DNA-binding protein
MTKDSSVTLRMSEELKKALQELALEDRRTLSSYIEVLLERHVNEKLAADTAYAEMMNVHRGQSARHPKKARK